LNPCFLGQFEYSPDTFLASIPEMRAFPQLSLLYDAWKSHVETRSGGAVQIVTCQEVTRVLRTRPSFFSLASRTKKGNINVWSRPTRGTDNNQDVVEPGEEIEEEFDEVVFCTDADAALSILGQDAGWMERSTLGNVKVGIHSGFAPGCAYIDAYIQYLWDLTVTHNDLTYMEKVPFHIVLIYASIHLFSFTVSNMTLHSSRIFDRTTLVLRRSSSTRRSILSRCTSSEAILMIGRRWR